MRSGRIASAVRAAHRALLDHLRTAPGVSSYTVDGQGRDLDGVVEWTFTFETQVVARTRQRLAEGVDADCAGVEVCYPPPQWSVCELARHFGHFWSGGNGLGGE